MGSLDGLPYTAWPTPTFRWPVGLVPIPFGACPAACDEGEPIGMLPGEVEDPEGEVERPLLPLFVLC